MSAAIFYRCCLSARGQRLVAAQVVVLLSMSYDVLKRRFRVLKLQSSIIALLCLLVGANSFAQQFDQSLDGEQISRSLTSNMSKVDLNYRPQQRPSRISTQSNRFATNADLPRLASDLRRIAADGLAGQKKQAARKHTVNLEEILGSTTNVEYLRNSDGAFRFFKGRFALTEDERRLPESFIANRGELFGFDDQVSDLRIRDRWQSQTTEHIRFQREVSGIPVWGSELVMSLQGDEIFLINGDFDKASSSLNTDLELNPETVTDAALRYLGRERRELLSTPNVNKVIHKVGNRTLVVAKVDISFLDFSAWRVYVDLRNNRGVDKEPISKDTAVAGSGLDLDGQRQNFTVSNEGGTYFLLDPRKPAGGTEILDIRNQESGSLWRIQSGDPNSGWDPAGVSALVNTQAAFDYYFERFERDSIDDNGQALLAVIHYGNAVDNAFWSSPYLVFGDGGRYFSNLAGCLDIVAHEITHGVIENTSNLRYQNQSGALNESFADIFAAMVDRDDWLMGEDCTVSYPGFLRSLSDPAQGLGGQPRSMSEYQILPNTEEGDWGGVHINSGIPNRAAYLIAEGLSAEGIGTSIGKTKMELIFYETMRALTPNAEFIDAASVSQSIAEQIYGLESVEALSVREAWDVVGVSAGTVAETEGGNREVAEAIGEDSMVYLYPVDGSHDAPYDPEEAYELYIQFIDSPFTGYDADLDIGPLNITASPGYFLPAPITIGSYTGIIYIDTNGDVYLTDGEVEDKLTEGGGFNSIAASPDGSRLAITIYQENSIGIIDIVTSESLEFAVTGPNYSNGDFAGFVTRVDSIAFDYSGRKVIFDYASCLEIAEVSSCDAENAFEYWSIGILDVETGRFSYPFPAQSPEVDVGYPKFANNSSQYFVFDFSDWENYEAEGQAESYVLIYDIVEQSFEFVGRSNIGERQTSTYGLPSFSGSDDYVIHQVFDDIGAFAVRTSVNAYVADLDDFQILNDFDVALPIAHRIGDRVIGANLQASSQVLDFGTLLGSTSARREVTLSNTGNREIEILGVSTLTGKFRHNIFPTTLLPGARANYTLSIDSTSANQSINDVLTIANDGDSGDIEIRLIASSLSGQDADADGVPDSEDLFPENPLEWADFDGDGTGDNADLDDDNDGVSDSFEIRNGLDPTKDDGDADHDGDGESNRVESSRFYGTQYLMTTSASKNVTFLHLINSSDEPQIFYGTLYAGDGEQLGSAEVQLHDQLIAPRGRLVLTSNEIEERFGVPPWKGPAMLEVSGTAQFELMSKLISPSGLISNTNCVREDAAHNIEGFDSSNLTFVRFINTSSETISELKGTLYAAGGNPIGAPSQVILNTIEPKQAIWLNREELRELFGSGWDGVASLVIEEKPGLKLLNLNFVNSETFFNFSCNENRNSQRVYLQTTSSSQNISFTHLINTSSADQVYSGTLYNQHGEQLGSPNQPLHDGTIPSRGRLIFSSKDLEERFGVNAWKGPAMLEVQANGAFELMTKLTSPSKLVSNTNCVRQNQVHNIEGFESSDMTYVRLINTSTATLNNIRGTLYDSDGRIIGPGNQLLISSLAPKQQAWINRTDLSEIYSSNWNGEAMLEIESPPESLRLLNLNFINNETFFNFSCYESGS